MVIFVLGYFILTHPVYCTKTPLSHRNATNFTASKITIHPLESKARYQPTALPI